MVQGEAARATGQPIGIVRDERRQYLDRDVSPELCIAREIDLSHSARTKERDDLVAAYLLADHRLHMSGSIRRCGRPSLGLRIQAEILSDTLVPLVVGKRSPFDPLFIGQRRAPAKKRLCVGPDGMAELLCATFDDVPNLLGNHCRLRRRLE